MRKLLMAITASTVISFICYGSTTKLVIGQLPPKLVLDGKSGGLISGGSWNSQTLAKRVSIIFYAAPSEKDLNQKASAAIKAAKFPPSQIQSYAIVNMAASAWPNFLISSKIKSSQKEFPTTIYVKDNHRTLVQTWGLADKSNVIVILDSLGKVVFHHDGKLDDKKIDDLLSSIRANLPKATTAPQKSIRA